MSNHIFHIRKQIMFIFYLLHDTMSSRSGLPGRSADPEPYMNHEGEVSLADHTMAADRRFSFLWHVVWNVLKFCNVFWVGSGVLFNQFLWITSGVLSPEEPTLGPFTQTCEPG